MTIVLVTTSQEWLREWKWDKGSVSRFSLSVESGVFYVRESGEESLEGEASNCGTEGCLKGPVTSSLENLSACVGSASPWHCRERSRYCPWLCGEGCGENQGTPCPHHASHSLISLEHSFAFRVKHFECVENGLLEGLLWNRKWGWCAIGWLRILGG